MWTLPPLPAEHVGPLLIGFSGGLDSTVLLHRIAHDPALRERGLVAIHVHHGLHADADAWAEHCRRRCAQWNVRCEIVSVEVSRTGGEGLEAAARRVRYAALARHLVTGGVLLTAHHRDDQAETFLLRALRASGVDGLAAMQAWRSFGEGWHWRPLLEVPRSELLAYAQAHALTWIEDPSNADVDLDRNFLRHEVLPLLRQRWPQAETLLARSAALAGESVRLLRAEDAVALAAASTLDPHALRVSALLRLPRERRARVLRHWIHSLDLPPLPGEGIARIEAELLRARDDAEAGFRWRHAVIRRWRDLLHAEVAVPDLAPDWTVEWTTTQPLPLPTRGELALHGQAWPTPLRVSGRRGGERLRLPGRSHSHALKKLLQSRGIPPWERVALPLLWEGDELLAAGNLLLSARLDEWLRAHATELRWQRSSPPFSLT